MIQAQIDAQGPYVGLCYLDPYGRRFVVRSQGAAGVVLDRAEHDWATVPITRYDAWMDMSVSWDDFNRGYQQEA